MTLGSSCPSAGVIAALRADLRIAPKHVLSALVAPLTIDSAGSFDQPVSFAGATFASGVPVRGLYVFNSYRATYRYEPVRTENWMFGVGITVKVRDAVTRLESSGVMAEKTTGYRFLEGGADNDEVYTFALVHYLAAGVVVRF